MIALLFSFADLAGQASVRSPRVRRRILAWLRSVEISAFRSVGHAAQALGLPVPPGAILAAHADLAPSDDDFDDPAAALELSNRFRALAMALACLLALAEQQAAASASSLPAKPASVASPGPAEGLAGWSFLRKTIRARDAPLP